MGRIIFSTIALLLGSCCHLSDPGEPGIAVHSGEEYNAIGPVESGRPYVLKARGVWRDWYVCTDALGYESKPLMKRSERKRRLPQARWFALVGAITPTPAPPPNDQASIAGLIDLTPYLQSGKPWVAPATGTLYVFANDRPGWWYHNNKGVIRLQLEPLPITDR